MCFPQSMYMWIYACRFAYMWFTCMWKPEASTILFISFSWDKDYPESRAHHDLARLADQQAGQSTVSTSLCQGYRLTDYMSTGIQIQVLILASRHFTNQVISSVPIFFIISFLSPPPLLFCLSLSLSLSLYLYLFLSVYSCEDSNYMPHTACMWRSEGNLRGQTPSFTLRQDLVVRILLPLFSILQEHWNYAWMCYGARLYMVSEDLNSGPHSLQGKCFTQWAISLPYFGFSSCLHRIAQAGSQFAILLHLPSKCWDHCFTTCITTFAFSRLLDSWAWYCLCMYR